MGDYVRMLSGMNTDFHNHSRDIIPSGLTPPKPYQPRNLTDRLTPAAQMYRDETISENQHVIQHVMSQIASVMENFEHLVNERYELDMLLMKSCDIIGELLHAVKTGVSVSEDKVTAAQDYLEIFGY